MAKPKARANREGTVYERHQVKNGRTYVSHVAEITWTDERDRVRRLRSERASRTAALAELQKLRDRVRAGRVPTDEVARQTVADVLERWLVDAERRGLRNTTLRSYRIAAQQHIIPHIGNVRATALERKHVDALMDDMRDEALAAIRKFDEAEREAKKNQTKNAKKAGKMKPLGKRPTNGLYARKQAYVALKAALSPYVVGANASDHPFPRGGAPRLESKTMTTWTEDEIRRFLAVAAEDRYGTLYLLALSTGMRQGEIFALKWGAVGDAYLNVRSTLDQRTKKIGPPKTKAARRRIDLADDVIVALEKQKESNKAAGLKVGPDALVFPGETGEVLHASNLYRRSFKPLMDDAGVTVIRFHDLRHTYATVALSRGIHPKIVQERLGHASIKITLDTYSHALPTMQRSAVDVTADLFRFPSPSNRRSQGKLPGKGNSGVPSLPRTKKKPL